MKLNDKQQKIVDAINVNLLVSASAGTGKTATMTNRIVSLINKGISLDNMLIVTFTKLAAVQMKQRISQQLANSPDNLNLRQQLQLIDSYSISTLHSLCAEIIRSYFYIVDIDPCFDIASDSDCERLQQQALDKVLDEHYKTGGIDCLVQALCNRNDDNLRKIILQIHKFICCVPDVDKWLIDAINKYDDNTFSTLLNNGICRLADKYKQLLNEYSYQCKQYGINYLLNYTLSIVDEINVSVNKPLQFNVDSITNMKFPICFAKYKVYDNNFACDLETFTLLFNNIGAVKAQLKQLKSDTTENYDNSIEQMHKLSQETVSLLSRLTQITKEFASTYSSEKKANGLLDFNDLEHLCLQILKDEKANQALKNKYKYIFVDEYQDINYVQEEIIELLKAEQNIFYVGDIKQSIYGFRQCQVQIFIDKLSKYNNDSDNNKVHYLTSNYRSDSNIIAFINSVFSKLMTNTFGGANYLNEQLDSNINSGDDCVTLTLIDDEDSEEKSITLQAIDIASKINKIIGTFINGKQIKYSDIAILTRSHAGAYEVYDVLSSQLIPVVYEGRTLSLNSVECSTLVLMCSLINNTDDDISLVSILSGYIGGLNNQQLADIRLTNKGTFYQCCINYCVNYNDEISNKLKNLFNLIDKYRMLSYSIKVDQLLSLLIDETKFNLYVLGLPSGKSRFNKMINLINSLKDKPYNYSVSKFVEFAASTSLTIKSDGAEVSDSVQLMTIHKSKGLEFDIVFVAGLDTKFEYDSDKVMCLYDYGIGMKYYDINSRNSLNTLSYLAIKQAKDSLNIQEELRLMYVAFTRAKSRLFISAANSKNELIADALNAKCMLDWIMFVLASPSYKGSIIVNSISASNLIISEQSNKIISYTKASDEELKQVKSQLNYKYPYINETVTPYKVVSSMLDYYETDTPYYTIVLADASAYGAEIGIAYHKIMETFDYRKHITNTEINQQSLLSIIASHIDLLINTNKLNKEIALQLNINLIYNCLVNEKFNQLISKGLLYKEIPFMYKHDYGQISGLKQTGTDTVIQGIIDLLIIDNGRATIIDFKFVKSSQLLEQRYKLQLNSYLQAVRNILEIQKIDSYIFSLADNKLVKIN